jgi:4-hydroxyacetophenone monooxygenase
VVDDLNGATSFDDYIADAIGTANIPALLMLLVHLTGDHRWLAAPYAPARPRGIADNDSGGLPVAIQNEIRDAALAAILGWHNGEPLAIEIPDPDLLNRMVSTAVAEPVPQDYSQMIDGELRACFGSAEPIADVTGQGLTAVIIGAGVSGICAAIQLSRIGVDCTILEKSDGVGGTWWENRYPGAGVDTPSHLYSFSFAPGDWPRYFSSRSDVQAYLANLATEFGVRPAIRFGANAYEARYDQPRRSWVVNYRDAVGEIHRIEGRLLISAVGALSRPKTPDIRGLTSFVAGPVFHTAQWPADFDAKGKHVALIGNGASAMQVLPAIGDQVASIAVFQRSPQWAAPFEKCKVPVPKDIRRLLLDVPLYRTWYRILLGWTFNDSVYPSLKKDPNWEHPARSVNAVNDRTRRFLTRYIESELEGRPDLIQKAVPPYPPYGKRMLLDNGWFRALRRENVELVTEPISEITSHGVQTADGVHRPVDAIILATGFDAVNFLTGLTVIGRHGRDLHEFWREDGARAYMGSMVPGFPNFVTLYGPNLQPGHGGSLMFMIECQLSFLMRILAMAGPDFGSVECTESAYQAYNAEIDRLHDDLIWTHPGMSTYYRNARGRVVVNTPFRVVDYWKRAQSVDETAFTFVANSALPAGLTGLCDRNLRPAVSH